MSTPTEAPKSNVPENEIRISPQTQVLRGVTRVEEAFKKFDNVTLTGINTGISRVLLITEIIKLKIPNLHQYNLIETIKTEKHEENEEKTDDNPRYSTRFKVELHKKQLPSPPKNSFYQAPYTEEEVKKISSVKPPERRPVTARGGRGGFSGRGRRVEGRGRGRGEGRGRGRGEGRGRGRGEGRGRGDGRGRARGRGEHREEHRGEGRGRGRGDARGGKKKQDIEGLNK